ncbi:MAG: phage antirepressor protein, partial [Patescibacteria group bacterium]
KNIKGFKIQNYRDHMDDFELIFTMLGERSTTEIHKTENSKGVHKLKQDASRGGRIAGIAKEQLEKEIGRTVVSRNNFLPRRKPKKKLK